MEMRQLLDTHGLILMEAAVVERLRRSGRIRLHPTLVHADLLYDEQGRRELQVVYQSYIDIAAEAKVPILVCTPTWRTNRDRVHASDISRRVNRDAVRFMNGLRDAQGGTAPEIRVGGVVGCRNDSYRHEEGLTARESEEFHSWQIDELTQAGVDFLIAATLPNVNEASGIAMAMAATGVPYVISFVINRDGCVLDGTTLADAVASIDETSGDRPLGFAVNCAHPSFLNAAKQPRRLFTRLIGYQANASSLDHADLDGAPDLQMEDVAEWGNEMLALNRSYGIKILGGCCGTGVEHLRYVVRERLPGAHGPS